jgi:hypothetical protein
MSPYGWGHSLLLGRAKYHLRWTLQTLNANREHELVRYLQNQAKFPDFFFVKSEGIWFIRTRSGDAVDAVRIDVLLYTNFSTIDKSVVPGEHSSPRLLSIVVYRASDSCSHTELVVAEV